MDYYIGINGVRSGPFPEALIHEKSARGEFPPQTLCWTEGWPQWRPFASVFPSNAPAPPPLPSMPAGAPVAASPLAPAAPPETSGLAITSFALGLSALILFITAIPAVICGHIACSKIKDSRGAQKGRGYAIAGLVIGYFIIALMPIGLMAAMAIPAFQKVRAVSQEKTIVNNLRQLDAAAEQWMLEKGTHQAVYADLVGDAPEKYIKVLRPVAGEDYTTLVIHDTDRELAVTTAAGRVITLPRLYTDTKTDFNAPPAAAQ